MLSRIAKILIAHKGETFHCERGYEWEQAAQRDCAISLSLETFKMKGMEHHWKSSEQLDLTWKLGLHGAEGWTKHSPEVLSDLNLYMALICDSMA